MGRAIDNSTQIFEYILPAEIFVFVIFFVCLSNSEGRHPVASRRRMELRVAVALSFDLFFIFSLCVANGLK